MTDSWDDTVEAMRADAPAPPAEHSLWVLRKDGRTAEALVRPHPYGQELRFLVNGDLLWSEVFKPGCGVALGEIAEAKRLEFETLGWTASTNPL